MFLDGASSSDGIVPVEDAELRRAVTVVGQELGLTSTFLGLTENVQHGRIMAYGVPLGVDCALRDATPAEMDALEDDLALSSINFTPSRDDRAALFTASNMPRIAITPRQYGFYLFDGYFNVQNVHYVTAGNEDVLLTGHRDVDGKQRTGSRSLPDLTIGLTRYVACINADGKVLCFARLVYVHWLFSSASAVAVARRSS
jgi:hypothetical protein